MRVDEPHIESNLHLLFDVLVHNARVEEPLPELWPPVSPRTAELIRRGAQHVAVPQADWVNELHRASLSGETMRRIAADPVLVEATRRTNLANLFTWVAANIEHPGRRVQPSLSGEFLSFARDLVRRGLDAAALDAYRKGLAVAMSYWTEVCFGLTSDPAELQDLLLCSTRSMTTFIDDIIDIVQVQMQAERDELITGTHAERLETVTLLLEGAPVEARNAENRLGYRLTGDHTAAVVWGLPGIDPRRLELGAEALVEATGCGRRLTVIANAATLWVWYPTAIAPEDVPAAVVPDQVQVTLGGPGRDRAGFRSSHLEAATAQRTLDRAGSRRRLAYYRDIELVALLEQDRQAADNFLANTLGELRGADPALGQVALTYLAELGNVSRTAERLYTHRNTVLRRLQRVDQLLPRPLAQNPIQVAAALELLSWRGDSP